MHLQPANPRLTRAVLEPPADPTPGSGLPRGYPGRDLVDLVAAHRDTEDLLQIPDGLVVVVALQLREWVGEVVALLDHRDELAYHEIGVQRVALARDNSLDVGPVMFTTRERL